jgi:hypothetical protein
MVLATKLSTETFVEFLSYGLPKTSQTTVTKRQWQGLIFSSLNNFPCLPTVTTAFVSLGTKGKIHAPSQSM